VSQPQKWSPIFDRFTAKTVNDEFPFVADAIPADWNPSILDGSQIHRPRQAFYYLKLDSPPKTVDFEKIIGRMKGWLKRTPGVRITSTGGFGDESRPAECFDVCYKIGTFSGRYMLWLVRGQWVALVAMLTEAADS